MSRWTHIRGALNCSASIFDKKIKKDGKEIYSMPFPEEQFILGAPRLMTDVENNTTLNFKVYEYAAPRVKPIIDKLIADHMPYGEIGLTYYINYNKRDSDSSSSCFDFPCEQKLFKQAIEDFYSKDADPFEYNDYEYLVKSNDINLSWVERNSEFSFTIDDNIRYCSGEDLLLSLEKLFKGFEDNRIWVDAGVLQWDDEYIENYYFQFKVSSNCEKQFSLISREDNHIIAYKKYFDKYDKDTKDYVTNVIESDNWKTLVKGE